MMYAFRGQQRVIQGSNIAFFGFRIQGNGGSPVPVVVPTQGNSIGGGQTRRGNVYHSPGIHPQKAAELKQQEIIAKRLEAQELHLLQNQLKAEKDKQSNRQKKSLEESYRRIMADIEFNNQELKRLYVEYNNIQAMIALMAAMPWINFGGQLMR